MQYESILFTNYFNIIEITFNRNYRISIILGLLKFYYLKLFIIFYNIFGLKRFSNKVESHEIR